MGKIIGRVFKEELEDFTEKLPVEELESFTLTQLKEFAKKLNIEFDSKIKKEDLIKLIEENQREE
ncbi:Rho termination factor N-terminal domain-containing protein [Clostridium perfringens]|uniref:Rho termination factor N-terminal domain-containing protein n=1 Tax=Clostridium perfringens TaxID=1502 RepID=UPI00096A3CC9|nr:Rho termination factor N-terminal domain-containing protein [Clostridium perfringens]